MVAAERVLLVDFAVSKRRILSRGRTVGRADRQRRPLCCFDSWAFADDPRLNGLKDVRALASPNYIQLR